MAQLLNECLAQAWPCPHSGLAAPPGLDPPWVAKADALPMRSHILASGPSSLHEAFAFHDKDGEEEEDSAPPGLELPDIAEVNAVPRRSQTLASGPSSLHALLGSLAFHKANKDVPGHSSLHEAYAFHEEGNVPDIAKTVHVEDGGFSTPRTDCPSSGNNTPAITPQPKMKCSPHLSSGICGQDGLLHGQTFSFASLSSALVDSYFAPPLVSLTDRLQVCESIQWPSPRGSGCLGSVEEDQQMVGDVNSALVEHLLTRNVQEIAEAMKNDCVRRNESLMAASTSEIEVRRPPLASEVKHGFAEDSPLWIWDCHGQIEVWPSPCAAPCEYCEPVAICSTSPFTPVPPLLSPQFPSSLSIGPVEPSCTMMAPLASVPGAAATQYPNSVQPGMSVAANPMTRAGPHTRISNEQGSNRTSTTAPALQQGLATGSLALKKARAMLPAVDLQPSRRRAK
eukprot:TRINITY_DN308_c0_g2_i1.p1 TRINITY_DN308_c0_g2~~TRINITY_DN308_c0_g2_i1.p1  ORF type:complete len:453 (-),score=63.09 TRINITY_DN308_c0_g2_i1:235-1593(-)